MKPRKHSKHRRALVAYHEAGHTVIAYYRKGRNLRLSIVPTDEHDGIAHQSLMCLGGCIDSLRVSLAGLIAEWMHSGEWDYGGAFDDLSKVVAWYHLYLDVAGAQEAERELIYCTDWVAEYVEECWSAIHALAQAALASESGVLENDQIESIIEAHHDVEAKPPRRWSKPIRNRLLKRLTISDDVDHYLEHASLTGMAETLDEQLALEKERAAVRRHQKGVKLPHGVRM